MSGYSQGHARRASYGGTGGSFSKTMNASKMSQATRDALDAIRVKYESQAREYETYKQLPKFSHVPLAVIHPTPKIKKRTPLKPTPDMEEEINISPARLGKKENTIKEIPESLVRPPITGGGGTRKR